MSTILGRQLSPGLCSSLYSPPFIPYFGEESAFSLITVCLEFLILLFLLSCIVRKKWYQCRGEENKARSLLLPFYDRVLYYYCGVTLVRILVYFIQFIYESATHYSKPVWFVLFFDSIGIIGIIGLEVFILFLLMQTSAGTKAYKRAYKATLAVCAIEFVIILFKNFYAKVQSNFVWFCVGELLEELLLFVLFVCVAVYSFFYQSFVKHRKRQRNRILYIYIASLCALLLILIIAYSLLLLGIDGYCLDIIDQYLYRLLFPWLAFVTIRSDSEFWRLLLLSWQTSSTHAMGEDSDAKDDNGNIWGKIKVIFGTSNPKSFLNPLIDALSMGVKMVDFTELRETSDPIAMGSTATVSTAKLAGETVAIKVFIFDELSIEVVSEFFRESLLISDLHHANIVEFKGACLRPPELCLVYEYCSCGDMTHLLLTQYFHRNFLHNNEDKADPQRSEPKLFEHRLQMLIDVSRGMTRLHDSGIIHRDLKTSNILVHYKAGKYIAKVCDFGSARKILSGKGMNVFGDSQSLNQNSDTYAAPKRIEHAKSTDFSKDNHELSLKQIAKSIGKRIKKHEIVIEQQSHHKMSQSTTDFREINQKLHKEKDAKHGRSMTVNLSQGIFGWKIKRGKSKSKKSNQNNSLNKSLPDRLASHSEYNDREYKTEEEERERPKHKASVNYEDIEEEEKYDQPKQQTSGGPADSHRIPITEQKGDFDEIDTMTEATDAVTELNYSLNDSRDPTKLAFSVSPILLTTQVGTLAFMAPEILSHVNIGALSGGWAKPKKEAKTEEKKEEKYSGMNDSSDSDQNLEVQKAMTHMPLPPQSGNINIPSNHSGNHLRIEDLPRYNDSNATYATTESNSTNTNRLSDATLQSETIVIKIDTKTDPNYANKGKNAQSYMRGTSPNSSFEHPKSVQTAPIGKHNSVEMREMNKNKTGDFDARNYISNPVTKQQKRFSREYIHKHRQLSLHKINIAPPPKKQLPVTPIKKISKTNKHKWDRQRALSGMSNSVNSFKKMFLPLSSGYDTITQKQSDFRNWQNRDIYYYNQPLPELPPIAVPSPTPYNLPLKSPPNSYDHFMNNSVTKPLPALPNERNDRRFSTISSRGTLIQPKNVKSYLHRALPPDPPKRKSRSKRANYVTRGRTQSKFSVKSYGRKASNLSANNKREKRDMIDDDARSVIYDTQKFEIVYEASNQALYNDSVDVYSFGVIAWEAAMCDRIYNAMDMKEIRDLVCQGKRMKTPKFKKCRKSENGLSEKWGMTESVYNVLIELINDCWAQSPIDRPKFFEIENRLELIQNLHTMKMEQKSKKMKMDKNENSNGYHD